MLISGLKVPVRSDDQCEQQLNVISAFPNGIGHRMGKQQIFEHKTQISMRSGVSTPCYREQRLAVNMSC
ncbi:hypothetical protein PoB_001490200 [Plakobranchus ocellatus]|uniref:Uncharacterized protein n=1 Tax=Plakobranchus ocellatus TaxID=259542 RepID=A0AAV3YZM5_9GAST|nr:hypothetical protein PoB_001490200 [Plakobranchus ocellatus]